jgi:hypothetical protein
MDAEHYTYDPSLLIADGQEPLTPVLPYRATGVLPSPPASNASKSSIADEQNALGPTPPAPETSGQDAGQDPVPRARKPRKPNSAKSPLFWVHMDQQSASEGSKEDTLKRIRSHVMSEHNRKKRLDSTKRYKGKAWKHLDFQPVETTAAVPGRVNSPRDSQDLSSVKRDAEDDDLSADAIGFPASSAVAESRSVGAPATTASPWAYLGSGANDPFYMMHTPLSGRMFWHLQHCKSNTVCHTVFEADVPSSL